MVEGINPDRHFSANREVAGERLTHARHHLHPLGVEHRHDDLARRCRVAGVHPLVDDRAIDRALDRGILHHRFGLGQGLLGAGEIGFRTFEGVASPVHLDGGDRVLFERASQAGLLDPRLVQCCLSLSDRGFGLGTPGIIEVGLLQPYQHIALGDVLTGDDVHLQDAGEQARRDLDPVHGLDRAHRGLLKGQGASDDLHDPSGTDGSTCRWERSFVCDLGLERTDEPEHEHHNAHGERQEDRRDGQPSGEASLLGLSNQGRSP